MTDVLDPVQDTPLLSSGQKRMWFLHRRDPAGSAYTETWAVRFSGDLNRAALEQGLRAVVARHEALRTVIVETDGEPLPLVRPNIDIRLLTPAGSEPVEESSLVDAVSQFVTRPFDLSRQVMRAALFPIREGTHVFVLAIHHIACDGVSFDVIQRELAWFYAAAVAGQSGRPASVPFQYADFVRWQRNLLDGGARDRQRAFWKERLSPLPAPARFPRLGRSADNADAEIAIATLSPRTASALDGLAVASRASPLIVVIAAYCTLLHRLSGETDLSVGTPVTNRMVVELQGVVGFIVNTVVIRVSAAGDPRFVDFLMRVREACIDAFENGDLPYEEVVSAAGAGDVPLFQGMVVFADGIRNPVKFAGLESGPVAIPPRQSKFEIALDAWRAEQSTQLAIQAQRAYFGVGGAKELLNAMVTLLDDVAGRPQAHLSTLSVLDRMARAVVMTTWNGSRRPVAETGVVQRIEARAARMPEAPALLAPGGDLDYRHLLGWSAAIAARLASQGVGPGVVVPLLGQGPEAVAGMLAILRLGGVLAPLDFRWPRTRIESLLARFGGPTVLLDQETARHLPWLTGVVIGTPVMQAVVPACSVGSEDPIYIISTSGSTGDPKCVVCVQGALANRFAWMDAEIGTDAAARVLQTTPMIYDSAIWQCLWPLTQGGAVVMPGSQDLSNGVALAQTIASRQITLIDFVPSLLNYYIPEFERTPDALASLHTIILGGERLYSRTAIALRGVCPHARILNLYGPTEATIGCIWHDVASSPASDEPIPIGLPIDNVGAVILDSAGHPCRIDQRGELHLAGRCLARGYFGDPELTAARFVENPFPELASDRLLRTGDLAYRRADGAIVCLGRTDDQIKIRGLRIDPGEVEAALVGMHGVAAAAVVASAAVEGDDVLTAYVVTSDNAIGADVLRAALRERLPREMIPTRIVACDELPTMPSGKVDRRLLASLPLPPSASVASAVAPSPTGEVIAALIASLLDRPDVDQGSSFFALGGHSMLAMRLLAAIQDTFGVVLPLDSIFEYPTPAELARAIDRLQHEGRRPVDDFHSADDGGIWPMSMSQSKMWLVERMLPGNRFFVNGRTFRLKGCLDVEALRQAFLVVLRQHPLLSARIGCSDGEPVFLVGKAPQLSLRIVENEFASDELILEETEFPFDLVQGPLFRAFLIRKSQTEHLLTISVHHIIADARSLDVVVRALGTAYASIVCGAPQVAIRPERAALYFVRRQRSQPAGAMAALEFWRRQLQGGPAELPRDPSLEPISRFSVGRVRTVVGPALLKRLSALSRVHKCTIFMVLLTALAMLLRKLTGKDDVRIGTAVSLRGLTELEDAVGLFINMLVVRMDLHETMTGDHALAAGRAAVLDAYRYRATPFEWLMEQMQQDASFEFPFNVVLLFQQPPIAVETLPGIDGVEPVEGPERDYDIACSDLDLAVHAMQLEDEIRLEFEYRSASFGRGLVSDWITGYVTLLESLTQKSELMATFEPEFSSSLQVGPPHFETGSA